jgi:Protein of unknown function (DUF995)
MRSLLVALSLLSFSGAALAAAEKSESLTLQKAKADGAVKLTEEALVALLPGRTLLTNEGGFHQRLTLDLRGGLFAVRAPETLSRYGLGQGKWLVENDGLFCTYIEWPRRYKDWRCGYVYRSGDEYLAFADDGDNAQLRYRFTVAMN